MNNFDINQASKKAINLSLVAKINLKKIYKNVEQREFLLIKPDDIGNLETYLDKYEEQGVSLQGKKIIIEIGEFTRYVKGEEVQILMQLKQKAVEKGADLLVYDYSGLYELEDVIIANNKIEEIVNKIQNAKAEDGRPLNELEKFMWAYLYVANRKYKKDDSNITSSRAITSILNSEYVVCAGYAALLSEICKRLGITTYVNFCRIHQKHANNTAIINNKSFYCDACGDSISEQYPLPTLTRFLVTPKIVKTMRHIKDLEAPFLFLNSDLEEATKMLKRVENMSDEESDNYYDIFLNSKLVVKYRRYIDIEDVGFLQETMINFYQTLIKELQNIEANQEIFSNEQLHSALVNIIMANGKTRKDAEMYANLILDETTKRNNQRIKSKERLLLNSIFGE